MKKTALILWSLVMCFLVISLGVVTDTAAAPVEWVVDGGFEAGSPNPYWTEYSLNFGTPLIDETSSLKPANSGDWFAWFGGSSDYETFNLEQNVTIPVPIGPALLSWYSCHYYLSGHSDEYYEIRIDGNLIYYADANDPREGPTYAYNVVDISGYADGGLHTLAFGGETGAWLNDPLNVSSFLIDDVSILIDPVPIPSTLLLLGSGLIGVLGFRRKFRKR